MITEKEYTNSSQVLKTRYENKTIYVTFKTGATYAYYEVPESVWESSLAAESIGKFINSDIKNKYKYAKL